MPATAATRKLEPRTAATSRWQESFYLMDLMLLHVAPAYYGVGVPQGDGAAVVVIPGFRHSDWYLLLMYAWLQRLGYAPYYSNIPANDDCPELLIRGALGETVSQARRATGRRVHLIGHSLGGILALSLGAQRPRDVASVITLGSPFRGAVVHHEIATESQMVRDFILLRHGRRVLPACYTEGCTCEFMCSLRRAYPASVARTAIYTRSDGMVDWRYCRTGNPTIDVEVAGTHAGLAFNAEVYQVMACRLARGIST